MYVTKDVIKKPFITKGFNINALKHMLAEREGFEPSIRYKRIHTFQACSFSHSDTSPESIAILTAICKSNLIDVAQDSLRWKKGQRIIYSVRARCQPMGSILPSLLLPRVLRPVPCAAPLPMVASYV
jgi:hypothetical protein